MIKSGFIGIIGRPNVGKSTLINMIVGEKIAITTHKPQTTRNRITGIKNLPPPFPGQFIFIDTPGIHKANSPLNESMLAAVRETIQGVDLLLLLIDAGAGIHPDDQAIIESLKDYGRPTIAAINKIDLIDKPRLLPIIDQLRHLFSFRAIIPLCAVTGEGTEPLYREIWELLPEGPMHFPPDIFTDQTERFLAGEIIREKITLLTQQEVPYSTAVVVEAFKEDEERNFIHIDATINVEKDSQKGIVIGKRGTMLKEIGRQARLEMERFFAARVYLQLFVRVRKDWSKDKREMKELGYETKGTSSRK
ncbi:MAG: GTPase Era [Smithellaceae bacterium]|nr:GTPase Era [Smithellaceae bacterium]